ncbi:MAG: fimbrillin family protein, partial [Bacteroidaceae bacterium]|nr:fimbrillin family protein [Bacteroidaceae bacterium]
MKKVKWLLAAAVVATVAACQSDAVLRDVVSPPTDSPKAIGFSSYSEKSTRGDVDNPLYLEYYHSTFTVYASKKSTVDNVISEVFDGGATALVTFSNNAESPNEWTYSPYRYWDKQANYNFIAVAPNANVVKYDWDATAANLIEVGTAANDFVTVADGYTLIGQNLQETATAGEIVKGFTGGAGKDTDIMTSALKPEPGATHAVDVVLDFKHILAKLNVSVAKANGLNDAEVYVKSLEISGLNDKGTYDESAYFPGAAAIPANPGDPTADPPVDPTPEVPAVPATSGWTASYSDVVPHAYKLVYSYAADGNNHANGGNDPD